MQSKEKVFPTRIAVTNPFSPENSHWAGVSCDILQGEDLCFGTSQKKKQKVTYKKNPLTLVELRSHVMSSVKGVHLFERTRDASKDWFWMCPQNESLDTHWLEVSSEKFHFFEHRKKKLGFFFFAKVEPWAVKLNMSEPVDHIRSLCPIYLSTSILLRLIFLLHSSKGTNIGATCSWASFLEPQVGTQSVVECFVINFK